MGDSATWTLDELRHELVDLKLESPVLIPIRVTGANLDHGQAQQRARTRWISGAALVILTE
jgi:hypothetical protein